MGPRRVLAVLLNAKRLNFDQRLDLSNLKAVATVEQHDVSYSAESILERVRGQEIVITKEMPLSSDVIMRFPDSVKLIVEAGTGYNNIALEAAASRQITVCNCPAYSTHAMAELVLTSILNFSCSMLQQQRMLWDSQRSHFHDVEANIGSLPHFELGGKTLGLIGGSGTIGSRVATLASVFGMRVVVSSRSGRAPPGATCLPLDELLRTSDFVSIHAPLNDETRGMLDAEKLALLKPTAYLINTARGAIVDEVALIDALRRRSFAGAALDVQDPEPPPPGSPLYELDNLILTPHIGWRKIETRQRLMEMVTDNVCAYVEGNPINVVR